MKNEQDNASTSKLRKLLGSFMQGDARSVLAKKNILGSFLVKGISLPISLLMVPITLGYLNKYDYGIWIALHSILTWINFFDIGLGNGLRNKLTESIAKNDNVASRIYISTAFFLLIIIAIVICVLYIIIQQWFDWASILNANTSTNLNQLVLIIVLPVCVSFALRFVGNFYQAIQLPVINDALTLITNLLSFAIILILTLTTEGNLVNIAFVYSISPVIVYIIAYFITFYGKYKNFRPQVKYIRSAYIKDLISLGGQFFIIQIAVIVVFSTTNLLISNQFGPEQVTPYNIAMKYFSISSIVFAIILGTMWSAVTDAYFKNDISWIQASIRKILKAFIYCCIVSFVMLLISNRVYSIWVGDKVEIPFSISLMVFIYTTISNWGSIFSNFLNGIGKIRLQLYTYIIPTLIFIPLAIFLSKILEIEGILLASCIVLSLPGILLPIQFRKIVNKKARGVWNK